MTPWTKMFSLLFHLSSLTSTTPSSLKLFQTQPACPLEPYYYTVICLHEHWLYKTWGLQTSNKIQLTDGWKKSRLDRRDQLEHNMKSSNSRETPAVINLGEWDQQFPWRWLPLELPKPKRLLWVDWLLGLAKVHQHDDGGVHSLSPRLMLLRQPEW